MIIQSVQGSVINLQSPLRYMHYGAKTVAISAGRQVSAASIFIHSVCPILYDLQAWNCSVSSKSNCCLFCNFENHLQQKCRWLAYWVEENKTLLSLKILQMFDCHVPKWPLRHVRSTKMSISIIRNSARQISQPMILQWHHLEIRGVMCDKINITKSNGYLSCGACNQCLTSVLCAHEWCLIRIPIPASILRCRIIFLH